MFYVFWYTIGIFKGSIIAGLIQFKVRWLTPCIKMLALLFFTSTDEWLRNLLLWKCAVVVVSLVTVGFDSRNLSFSQSMSVASGVWLRLQCF